MGKLYDTFTKIEAGRKKCIDSLNIIDIPTPENASFEQIASNIRIGSGDVNTNIIKEQHLWERPKEWINTEEILQNAPELEGYVPAVLFLLHDNKPDITLTLTRLYASQPSYIMDAFYMSDGTFVTHENTSGTTTVTHTWDTSKDIPTGLHYNLRYMILYSLKSKIEYSVTSNTYLSFGNSNATGIGDSLLEVVVNKMDDVKDKTSKTIYIPARTGGGLNVQRIHVLDCYYGIQTASSPYNSIKEIQIDYSGELAITVIPYELFYYQYYRTSNYMSNIILRFPNATRLYGGWGNSSARMCACYIYMPNVETLNLTGYGDMSAPYVYAPRLKSVTGSYYLEFSARSYNYVPSVDYTSRVKDNKISYLHELFYRQDSVSGALPTDSGREYQYLYNEILEHITNTSFTGKPSNIVLPALKTVANPDMFVSTTANDITNFVIGEGFKSSLNISNMKYLPTINILDILYKLADVTGEEETYTLTLGTTLLALLSDEEKAIATNKGWVLA